MNRWGFAWSNPLLAIPLLAIGLFAVARLARLRPALRPLVLPYALAALAGTLALLAGRADPLAPGWLSLLVLLPVLVLSVRASVILLQELFRRSSGQSPPSLLESIVAVLLYGIGAGVIAHRWLGLELGPLLVGGAVVAAVVGLALQETLGNLFAGVALHSEALQVGDWVRLGEHEGRVEQVSWRATRLRTWYGDTLTIPNNEAARRSILNFSQPRQPHSRVVSIGVNHQTPPNKVTTVLGHLLEQIPQLPPEPAPVIRVVGYHDSSIQYEIRYFLSDYADYRAIEGEIYRLIWYHFRRHGIAIPFPIRDVYLHQPESADAPREQAETRLMRALRGIDLFRPLSDEELRQAAANFRQLHYAAGERLIEEGSSGEGFFVIDRGEVEVSKEIGGKRRTLARLMEGQFFGEMALLTGEPRSATVIALTDVDVFTIDKGGFHEVLVKNPAIAVDISTILSERQEALVQAKGDVTARFESLPSTGELKQRILDGIRSYFGL